MEVWRCCHLAELAPPGRNTVSRRWAAHREAQAAVLANDPAALVAPGSFGAAAALDIVQSDHTQADVFLVDEWVRRSMGRPWLSVAIDLATRCVVGIYVGMERPNAATVALPKAPWLASIGSSEDVAWPMHGLAKVLHLDNAAEFHSRALRMGCSEYGIELMYRRVGRPHFSGHVERMNRTLMERLRGLPGATGNSPKGRKARKPEETAALTLREFERWLVLEIAKRYHHSEHRGLMDATPADTWQALAEIRPPRQLPLGADEALQFLVQFMPVAHRTIQSDGLTLFNLRC
jgi:putative transposase